MRPNDALFETFGSTCFGGCEVFAQHLKILLLNLGLLELLGSLRLTKFIFFRLYSWQIQKYDVSELI